MFQPLSRFPASLVLLVGIFLIVNLVSCTTNEPSNPLKTEETSNAEGKISKVDIQAYGKVTELKMSYEKNVINIEFQPYKGNMDSRVELNKKGQIREVISGAQRMQYLYDDQGRNFGIFTGNGTQQIMFDYHEDQIVAQHSIVGNDTVVSYLYEYENDMPSRVSVHPINGNDRIYLLEFSTIDNALTGFNEMVLPAEIGAILGIPAMYGKKYLKKATRIDEGLLESEPLTENYTPALESVQFEIARSGKQETLKLVSDGSRQWSATIHW
ncbi:MAG: hypothetical protein ACFHU9_10225 [Fluviicola sp.]